MLIKWVNFCDREYKKQAKQLTKDKTMKSRYTQTAKRKQGITRRGKNGPRIKAN